MKIIISPILISPSSNQILVNDLEQEFTFTFDEKISLFEIKNNNGDVIVSKPSNTLSFENQYSDMIKFSFESGELTVGTNKYIVSYIDFAGNEVEKEIDFAFKGEDLTLTLLTRKDYSNLKYFYEIENSDFFENKILKIISRILISKFYFSKVLITLACHTNTF